MAIAKFKKFDSWYAARDISSGRSLLNEDDPWGDALPDRDSAAKITVTGTSTQPLGADGDAEIGIRFYGDFNRDGSDWFGEVTKVGLYFDGQLEVVIKGFKGNLDISDVQDLVDSGHIWDQLGKIGFSGKLSDDHDRFQGSLERDVIDGGKGNDVLFTYDGDDKIIGGKGDDTFEPGKGDDKSIGGKGNDYFGDSNGSDIAKGGKGDDTFDGETLSDGYNQWWGGAGADLFQMGGSFRLDDIGTVVKDFNAEEGDLVDLSNMADLFFNDYTAAYFIGQNAFTGGGNSFLEVRMENGIVTVDTDGDGEGFAALYLEGVEDYAANEFDWLKLPDDMSFELLPG